MLFTHDGGPRAVDDELPTFVGDAALPTLVVGALRARVVARTVVAAGLTREMPSASLIVTRSASQARCMR